MQDRTLVIIGILLCWAITVTGNAVNMISNTTPDFAVAISSIVIVIFTLIIATLISVVTNAKDAISSP